MDERMCADCSGYVSQEECQRFRDKHDECLSRHEMKLNENAVEHATFSTEMRGVKFFLGGIFTVTFLSFLANIVQDFVK